MWTRHGLIPSRFLLLLLPLILVSCSGGDSEAPPSPATQPSSAQPPAPAGLIWRHDNQLVRSQTDGSGQVTLADEPAGIEKVVVSGRTVVYEVPQSQSRTGNIPLDIRAVQIDGMDAHLVRRSAVPQWFYLLDVIGPWVLHTDRTGPEFSPPPPSLASIQVNGTAPRILSAAVGSGELWQAPNYERQVQGRAIFEFAGNYFTILPNGADLRQLTFYPPFPHGDESFTALLGTRGVVGDSLIYQTVISPSSPTTPEGTPKLFAVPAPGGPVVKLGAGPEYEILGAVINTRVVYNRCVLMALPDFDFTLGQCDVSSVQSDGHGRVALTATRDINYVQGAIGEQVIIRRSQRGGTTDSLFSIPVSGGAETPLLTLSAQNEFVSGIVGDRIILKRPTGLWSLKGDGSSLVQLTSDASDDPNREAGPFICFARGPALWCVPADGSGPATQVTTNGWFVAGL